MISNKIKFFSDYEVSDKLLIRFLENYNVYDDDLQFVTEGHYDYAVVFNRAKEMINPDAKIITVIQEPSWCETHSHKYFLLYSDYLIVHDPLLFETVNHLKLGGQVIQSPAYMFFHDRVNHSFFSKTEYTKKSKKLSFIVSGQYFPWGNYQKRIEVLSRILESDLNIDIYGYGLNILDKRYKGAIENKYTALIPYEYSIAIENSNEYNYISEKFFDCVLCNTTPIYNGAPNISEVYDESYFRNIDIFDPNIVDTIKKITALPAPGVGINKSIYLVKYNLYTKLKEIVEMDINSCRALR